jgi:hypothetical protein
VDTLKKKGAINTGLKKRWFELVGPRLFYYKSQKQKTPTGVILLKNTQVKKDSSKKFTFNIVGQHLKRNYEIVAKNEPDMENWIRELQNVINKSTSNVDKDDKKENESEKKKKSDELYSSEKDDKKKSWS